MTLSVDIRSTPGDFSLDVRFDSNGPVTSLFGRSGSGKTTLINLIAGLGKPDRGRIAIDDTILLDTAAGIDLPPHRRRVGYVFQEARLFPHMSVRSNLFYGYRRVPEKERWADPTLIIDLLGVGPVLQRRPAGLSGGERQRVAIGRALLASPRLVLMDEPLASLDAGRKDEVLPYLERLRDEMKVPIVYVSHTVDEVVRLADTVVLIDGGQVIASGPVNDVFSRLDLRPYTGRFEASVILRARVINHDAVGRVTVLEHGGGELRVPALPHPTGTEVRVRVRARDVALAVGEIGNLSIRNRLAASVVEIGAPDGAIVEVRLDVAGDPLIARVTRDAVAALDLAPGRQVTALIKSTAIDNRSDD